MVFLNYFKIKKILIQDKISKNLGFVKSLCFILVNLYATNNIRAKIAAKNTENCEIAIKEWLVVIVHFCKIRVFIIT